MFFSFVCVPDPRRDVKTVRGPPADPIVAR
jgi:hypothetical protein